MLEVRYLVITPTLSYPGCWAYPDMLEVRHLVITPTLSYPGCWAYPDMLEVGCQHGPC